MSTKTTIAKTLYKAISTGRLSFHDAIRLYSLPNIYLARSKSPSGRFSSKSIVNHIIEATDPQINSAWASVLFPAEILCPFHIYPITLEVMAGVFASLGLAQVYLDAAEGSDVPNTMCSFHRMLMGISSQGILGKPYVVGATSVMCDGNVKSFAEVAKEQGVPFIFLDVPYEQSKEGIVYVKDQLTDALKKLSELTGIHEYQNELCKVVKNVNRAFSLFKRLYNLKKGSTKNLFRGYESANFAFPYHFMLGGKQLIKMIKKRCEDVESGRRPNRFFKSLHINDNTCRLMWLHIVPQYDSPVWSIIDNGETARVVCDEYSTVSYEDYDEADPLGSIAKRLINHPSNGPLQKRIDHIVKVARDFKVDGIIHYSSWGCHQAAGNVYLLGKELEAAGFRFLNLNGDAVDERNSSMEQHRTRVEAFLENRNV